ncbi:hypothetical protein LP52_15945 [Streptomonospora alba]|uniref:Uncharacterized protein n=1 Tax=Streptomonospora alba TaxID=183763 RepID=A0A0C2JM97_9ACTN|nr:hypothetical protein [Streptomonospora alba]KIH98007.1 hypothetical protein LP52_15945 [Streptomonospora alba]
MAPKRRITTRGEYAGVWAMVVLTTTVALWHASVTVRLWLDGSKVEILHWGPIVSMSLFAVWGIAHVLRYHRASPDLPEEEASPAIWAPRER